MYLDVRMDRSAWMHVRGEDQDRFDRLNANGAERMQATDSWNLFVGKPQDWSLRFTHEFQKAELSFISAFSVRPELVEGI